MAIFYDIVGPTAVAAGTGRSTISSTYKVPSAARELLGVYLQINNTAPGAAEPFSAVFDIIGTDFRYQPCELLFPIGHSTVGEVDCVLVTPSEFWQINAPLEGTETLNLGCQPSVTMAGGGFAAVTMVYSTVRTGLPVIYGKFPSTRFTATGTTAATSTALNAITVSNAVKMYEIIGVAVLVPKADEEVMTYMTLNCTQWSPIQTVKFMNEALQTSGGATTASPTKLTRLPFDARFIATQATVESTGYNYSTITTAGVYILGIRYYGTPK